MGKGGFLFNKGRLNKENQKSGIGVSFSPQSPSNPGNFLKTSDKKLYEKEMTYERGTEDCRIYLGSWL
jgi:hypothetical protein